MRLSSFKARLFFIAIAASILIVAFIRVATYFVIADQMDRIARQETQAAADAALGQVRRDVTSSLAAAAQRSREPSSSMAPRDDAALAMKEFLASATRQFGEGIGGARSSFALYDETGSLRYRSSAVAEVADPAARALAIAQGRTTEARVGGKSALHNLLFPAELGVYVAHVPFDTPEGRVWVLDAVYDPSREARTMDALRAPMIWLGVLSTLLTVAATVGTTLWVLRLVDELRVAADSVDAGRLDVRLPEHGRNEIGDLGRSINSLIGRLSKAAEAQTRFVADASHELATPVAGIRGHINILRSWGATDPAVEAESLEAIDRESRRMVRLTRQLLEIIRSERTLAYVTLPRDINAVVRRVLADGATRYVSKGLDFQGPLDQALTVWIDPDRMEQVLGILVDNAAKFTPEGGRVSVSTEAARDEVVIIVSDTGPGIPADDLPNIFDRFYRSDISRSSEGFGLGLSIAKRIVEAGGGRIDAMSRLGRGTTFTIRMPDRPR